MVCVDPQYERAGAGGSRAGEGRAYQISPLTCSYLDLHIDESFT